MIHSALAVCLTSLVLEHLQPPSLLSFGLLYSVSHLKFPQKRLLNKSYLIALDFFIQLGSPRARSLVQFKILTIIILLNSFFF